MRLKGFSNTCEGDEKHISRKKKCYKILCIHSFSGKVYFLYFCMTEQLYLKLMKSWKARGTEWMSDGVMQIISGGGRKADKKPSEVCIKTVVSYSCCIRATRKPES